jgi:hypothetical protein
MHNYWVVGASWDGGNDNQDAIFVEKGIWQLGWKDGFQPKKAAEMKAGDRIAIKRMKGKGQTGIKIMHIGIIKGVNLDTNNIICTVNWIVTDLNRNISESRGCFKSVHGPFKPDLWVNKVFCL